jgi:dihydrodipicolinate synthase/N-acetylneuraminate lyase
VSADSSSADAEMGAAPYGEGAPATTAPLRGTWGTALLPVRPDERIDFAALEVELDVLLGAGLAGVYTCGTAGEFHTLEEDEFDELSELVAQMAKRAGVAFQIGASHMSGQVSLSRIRRARALGPTAIQIILPDWLPLSPNEVEHALERMLEAAGGTPVVLYNPPHAKTACSPEQLGALAHAFPAMVGVKVAGDDAFYSRLHAAAPHLSIFAPGHELAHARRLGAVGSYSNVACMSPAGALAWELQMDSDPVAAEALGDRIMAFFDTYIGPLKARGYSNTALDKALAAVGGWAPVGTRVRWPYNSVADDEVALLAPLARAALPELF